MEANGKRRRTRKGGEGLGGREARTIHLERVAHFLLQHQEFSGDLELFRDIYGIPKAGFSLEQTLAYAGLARAVHGFYDAWRKQREGVATHLDGLIVQHLSQHPFQKIQDADVQQKFVLLAHFTWVKHLENPLKVVEPQYYTRRLRGLLNKWAIRVPVFAEIKTRSPREAEELLIDLIYHPATLAARLAREYRMLDWFAADDSLSLKEDGLLYTFTKIYPDLEVEFDETKKKLIALRIAFRPGISQLALQRFTKRVNRVLYTTNHLKKFGIEKTTRSTVHDTPRVLEVIKVIPRILAGMPPAEAINNLPDEYAFSPLDFNKDVKDQQGKGFTDTRENTDHLFP